MRSFTFLFHLVFFSKVVFGDDLLSKFHQNEFKLKDVRIQLMSFNKDYYNFFEIKAFKFNRTTTAHNMTCNFKVDVEDKIEVLVQMNKFLSNEYRHFPVRFQVNSNKAFKANIAEILKMLSCGNLKNGLIFSKDVTYQVCNFVIDETQFPPLLPTGKFRSDIQLLYLGNVTAIIHMLYEVYTLIKY